MSLHNNFFNTSVGNGSNQVYGLAWCRADVSSDTCSECLNDSISVPLRDCPESKDLEIWSSLCSLRFSNESFFVGIASRHQVMVATDLMTLRSFQKAYP